MVHKNWVKLPNDTEWYNRNKNYSVVRVWEIGLPFKERKRRGIGRYGVITRIGLRGKQTKRTFFKRAEALTYALAYMRTH